MISHTFRNLSIKQKLITINMLTCISVLLLTGAIHIISELPNVRSFISKDILTHAEILADSCKVSLAFDDSQDATEILRSLRAKPSIVYACVYNQKGDVFAEYTSDNKFHKESDVLELREDGYKFTDDSLDVFRTIVLDGEIIGSVYLRSDLQYMYKIFKGYIRITVFVILFGSLFAYLLSSRLQKIISGPILNLAEVAKTVSEKKDYSTRAVRKTNDEIGVLIKTFNDMLEQIQQHESALVKAKDELEARVKTRTADLTTANEHLTKEVAERKKAEEQLRKTEEKYRMQFEGALDAIFVADAKTGIIVDCNPAATELVGREQSELVGQHQRILHPPEIISGEFSRSFKEHLEEKHGQILDTSVITKNGEIKDVAIKANLIEVRGRKLLQGIFRDITEHKKAEQRQNQLLEQLERTNQELEGFAYIISHDLKAPLRGISTLTEWITSDYADKLDDDGKEQLKLLSSRVDRMHNLIEGVLTYSKVGRTEETETKQNLNELVAEVIDMLYPPENITITVDDNLPTITCEKTRIVQVFQNLLSNAIKYMDKPEGLIKIGCTKEDGFWKFSIADNGPGIEEKYFDKIFQIFQTLSDRDSFESTGVGLTVVKKIVELYGGRIWVESTPGEGTTFFFTFLIQQQEEKETEDAKFETNYVS